jgi:hypothetical protein
MFFLMCIKFNINIQRKWLEGILQSLEHTRLGATSGAPDTIRAQAEAPRELTALKFSQSHSTKIHRTVRWATGLSGEPMEQLSTSPTVDCRTVWPSEVRVSLQSQNAPDCPVPQEDIRLQQSTAPNPNGRLTWHAPDSEQYNVHCTTGLSGVPIDNNGWNSGWGYKYPPTTTIQAIQAFQPSHSILEQKHTLQDTIKASNPLQAPKSNQVLSDLREGDLCFFCCLDCLLLLTLIFLSTL